jgi:predicted amidophosphoribosyltransferase
MSKKYHPNKSRNWAQNKKNCLPNLRDICEWKGSRSCRNCAKRFLFCRKIAQELKKIPLEVSICEVLINKQNPELPIHTLYQKEQYANKGLILIDDVLNSGTTLIHAIRHFLDVPWKKTAVLVDRNHKKYPVKKQISKESHFSHQF